MRHSWQVEITNSNISSEEMLENQRFNKKTSDRQNPMNLKHIWKYFAWSHSISRDESHTCGVVSIKNEKRKFYSKSAPIQHQWLPTGKKPYHRKVHRKTLSWKSPHLIVYQRICTSEKPSGCKEHWKAFQCKPRLSEHGRTGTSKNPYHWEEPRKPFYRKPCLTQHKRTLDKLHECRESEKVLCGRSWHQRIHACIECVKAFHSKSDLS